MLVFCAFTLFLKRFEVYANINPFGTVFYEFGRLILCFLHCNKNVHLYAINAECHAIKLQIQLKKR